MLKEWSVNRWGDGFAIMQVDMGRTDIIAKLPDVDMAKHIADLHNQAVLEEQLYEQQSAAYGKQNALIKAAREKYGSETINVDYGAKLSQTDDGAWVAAWVFVPMSFGEEDDDHTS